MESGWRWSSVRFLESHSVPVVRMIRRRAEAARPSPLPNPQLRPLPALPEAPWVPSSRRRAPGPDPVRGPETRPGGPVVNASRRPTERRRRGQAPPRLPRTPIGKPDGSADVSLQLAEIHRFCTYVSGHPFWSEQIVQLHVNRRGEYELIPRVGAHQILMGSMEEWKLKLRNLELLYSQGFSAYGWNSYRSINLKYTNQVICTKR